MGLMLRSEVYCRSYARKEAMIIHALEKSAFPNNQAGFQVNPAEPCCASVSDILRLIAANVELAERDSEAQRSGSTECNKVDAGAGI